ncbi:MAG: hypothetical protein AB7V01_07670, partial [Vicinamibacterales bacterium]
RLAQPRLGRALQQARGAARDVASSSDAPTPAQALQFSRGAARVPDRLAEVRRVLTTTVSAFAADLERRAPASVPRVTLPAGGARDQ